MLSSVQTLEEFSRHAILMSYGEKQLFERLFRDEFLIDHFFIF